MEKRIIKFRIWNKARNKWHFKEPIDLFGEVIIMGEILNANLEDKPISLKELNDLVPLQYTGLKDKKGKEIYEGDIIKAKSYYAFRRWWKDLEDKKEIDEQVENQKNNVYEISKAVEFSNGCFKWNGYTFDEFSLTYLENSRLLRDLCEKGEPYGGDSETKFWDFEVIGNIYENSDLLNNK